MTEQQAAPAVVEHHEDEGHSIAAWIGVFVIVAGFVVGTVCLFLENTIGTWIGVALVPLGAILWPVLKLAGLGPKDH